MIVGDKTAQRSAGSLCRRDSDGAGCECTPYKQNTNGKATCKWNSTSTPGPNDDIGNINTYSYLEHEFRQAIRRKKNIVIVYNSMKCESQWLPSYMNGYEDYAHPFWTRNKVSDLFCINASSYVIPTNTFFRTVMEGEYISPQSVQGAFQLKYFNEKTDELDNLIAASLEQQGIVYEESSDIHGTVKKYPIGTVAKVDHKSRHYYFVAINDVNRNGKPENQGYANLPG